MSGGTHRDAGSPQARLDTALRIDRPDDFYEALIAAHRGLSDEQSVQLNCRLVLLLANQVGDLHVLREALTTAREGIEPASEPAPETAARP
jgi:hypothetical protein